MTVRLCAWGANCQCVARSCFGIASHDPDTSASSCEGGTIKNGGMYQSLAMVIMAPASGFGTTACTAASGSPGLTPSSDVRLRRPLYHPPDVSSDLLDSRNLCRCQASPHGRSVSEDGLDARLCYLVLELFAYCTVATSSC